MTGAQAGDTIVLPYNDLAAVEEAFKLHSGEIACVITEAAPGNMGVVPPRPASTRAWPGSAGRTARSSSPTR